MITKYEKANKGKLLVAVLALFVVLAGAAVVLSDEPVNAAATSSSVESVSPLEATTTVVAGGSYYIAETPSSNVNITVDGNVNLYINSGVTVGITTGTSAIVKVMVATNYAGTTVTTYSGLSLTVPANTSTAVSITNANGSLQTSADIDDNAEYGIYLNRASGNDTYYAPGSVENLSISYGNSADSVSVKKGTATVNQGNNTVTIVANNTNGITVTAGNNTYPVLGGTGVNADTVTITGGFFTGTVNTAKLNAVNLNSGTYSNQIVDRIGTTAVTAAEINGNVTQASQVGSASIIDGDASTNGITVTFADANSVLTINNNVNVYVKEITIGDGNVNLFGALYSDTATNTIEGKLGPNGYYNENITFSGVNTNITSGTGEDFEVAGEGTTSVDDAIIKGEGNVLTIPAGATFTINGNFGLNGQKLVVLGTLVIENRATIYGTGATGEGIYLQGNGAIQNNGTIGKMMPVTIYYDADNGNDADEGEPAITMQGVSGVSYTIDRSGNMIVSGNITATSGAKANNLTISNAQIGGEFTTASKVILNLASNVTISKNATVILNGNVANVNEDDTPGQVEAVSITLEEGASISVNGGFLKAKTSGSPSTDVPVISIIAETGLLGDNDTLSPNGSVTISPSDTAAGFTMYVKKVAVANGDETDYYLRAYINGTLTTIGTNTAGTISINGQTNDNEDTVPTMNYVYVAADETISVGKGVSLNVDYVVVEGSIVYTSEAANGNANPVNNYIGATYTVETTGSNNQPIYTYYYTTLAAAMDAIETANDDGITANVIDLNTNVTVADGQLVDLTVTGTVSQDAVITVENGGTLTGNIAKVDGKMVIQADADSVTPVSYDVMSTSEDGTVTYAGISVAISEAQPGDSIAIVNAQIGTESSKQSLTIPQGVKVTVSGTLTIYGDLTVADEATLTGGTLNMARPESKITVNGTLDLSDGNVTGVSNFVLTSNGTTLFGSNTSVTSISLNGAYYTNEDADTVVTTIANAVAYAAENDGTIVYVKGTVNETADLTLDGVDVTLVSGAKVTLGNVTLSDARITSTGAELTATVSAMNGEGDAAVSGVVSVNKSALVLNAAEVVNAAGTTVYTYTISAISGTMAVQSGTVVISGDNVTTADKSKFAVASGATLLVTGELTVSGTDVEFTVDGTLDVDEGTVNFNGGKSVINGTANIHGGNGVINAALLVITGTVNVSATENDSGTFQITGSGVQVGAPIESVGAAGSIVGPATIDEGKYVLVFAGADVSGAQFNMASGESTVKTTTYYVNGVEYATAYAEGTVAVGTPVTPAMIKEISGIDDNKVGSTITWTDAEGKTTTATNVGDAEALYAKFDLAQVTVTVSSGSQISLYIDGVKYSSGANVPLTIGTHTVEATVNPGYTGDVTITFNGQTVTNGTIEITEDMDAPVLSAIGNITIDGASTGSSDGGMGIVEILLVILVVVVVILAIIVVLRMMRS